MSGTKGISTDPASVFQNTTTTEDESATSSPPMQPINFGYETDNPHADEIMHRIASSSGAGETNSTSRASVRDVGAVQETRTNSGFREVTKEQVRRIMSPGVPDRLYTEFERNLEDNTRYLNKVMQSYNINTPARQAAFLATVGAETYGLSVFEEEPSRHASSRDYYHGRGAIQLTGEDNYLAASQYFRIGEPDTDPPYRGLVDCPDLVLEPGYAFPIAGWFWSINSGANREMGDSPHADLQDFRQASGIVNSGSENGPINNWGDRLRYYKRALAELNIEISPEMARNIDRGIQRYTGRERHRLPARGRGYE